MIAAMRVVGLALVLKWKGVAEIGDIWTTSAQKWVKLLPLTAEHQPRDYGPFIEAYRAQGRF